MTRMELKQMKRRNMMVNALILLFSAVALAIAFTVFRETESTWAALERSQATLERAQQVNAECEALLEEVAPWRK